MIYSNQEEHAHHYTTDTVDSKEEHAHHYTTDTVDSKEEHAHHYTTDTVDSKVIIVCMSLMTKIIILLVIKRHMYNLQIRFIYQ